jgi:hypothetical protein
MTTPRKRAPRTRKPASPTPPPVQNAEPEYDLGQPEYRDDYYPELSAYCPELSAPQRSPMLLVGCLFTVAMVMMLGVIGLLLWDRYSDRRSPDVAPVPVMPVNNLAVYTAPIAAKLATDKAKAAIVADAYTGLTAAIAGKSGQRLTSSKIFEAAHAAFLTDLDAMGGVAVGAEIDQAIGSYLGMTKDVPIVTQNEAGQFIPQSEPGWNPIAFDASHRAKLVEITAAIATAAEAAR